MQYFELAPIYKEALWGGRRIYKEFGAVSDLDKISESWVLSDHVDGDNLPVELKDVTKWGSNLETFNNFPLLIKIIDANDDLSIQVHPDKAIADKYGDEDKNECWYILDSDKDAYVYWGLKEDISKEELADTLKNGDITSLLNKTPVKKGDVLMIKAGTVHAIGKGCLLAEIQKNANTTYRLFDFNRVDKNANKRELHIEKGLDAIHPCKTIVDKHPLKIEMIDGNKHIRIAEDEYFKCESIIVDDKVTIKVDKKTFKHLLVLDGSFYFIDHYLQKGASIFLPAQDDEVVIEGSGEILVSWL